MSSLLPPTATTLERAVETATATVFDLGPVRTHHDPDEVPAVLLPWVAWQRSVDAWVSTWSDDRKRAMVAAAPAVHRAKGTPASLEDAIAGVLGWELVIEEWHEDEGALYIDIGAEELPPGTVRLEYRVDGAVAERDLSMARQLVRSTKRASIHVESEALAPVLDGSAVRLGASSVWGAYITLDVEGP